MYRIVPIELMQARLGLADICRSTDSKYTLRYTLCAIFKRPLISDVHTIHSDLPQNILCYIMIDYDLELSLCDFKGKRCVWNF